MKVIHNNPYRIAGILSTVTAKELEKQRGKIRAFIRVGKEIKSEFDFQILENISRTEDSINQAFSNVEQNQDKVNHSLFWFLNASTFDKTALEYLKNGDGTKAIEIWEKVTQNKEVHSNNFSAFNNLGTFKLLSQNQDEIKEGIAAKIKLIESDYFESFVHSVADETFTIDNQKQSEKLIDELLTQFKNQYSSSEILQLFSGCNGTTQIYLSKKYTEEPLLKIESQIESCKKKRKADKGRAYEFGLRLFTNTKDDLSLLKSLLGISDLKYKAIADQLANEIMQCGIDYFQEYRDRENEHNHEAVTNKYSPYISDVSQEASETFTNLVKEYYDDLREVLGTDNIDFKAFLQDYIKQMGKAKATEHFDYLVHGWENNCYEKSEYEAVAIELLLKKGRSSLSNNLGTTVRNLFKSAKSIAVGTLTKERIEENIDGLQEWTKIKIIKSDIDAVNALIDNNNDTDKISPLIFKKDTIDKAEKLIKRATPHLINIKAVLKSDNEMYLGLSTNLVAKAQNYVIETINSAQQGSGAFEEVNISELKSKLKKAWKVTQLLGSLDMVYGFQDNYQNNKETLQKLCNQLDLSTPIYSYEKIPQINFIIKDAEITNTDQNNSPLHFSELLYEKYVRYIGLTLNIMSYGTQTINFYLKYINPEGKYSNSKNSPEGYTTSSERTITSNTQTIQLGRWGNSEKPSYKIGNHSIEVWVDDFMIYKKEFTIDLSPSQKIEKEIEKAEIGLKEIKQTNYFTSEISSARNEMIEINKFKLFRSSSERQEQIETQQQKIDSLLVKSDQEKKRNIRNQEERIYKLKMELSAEKY